MGQSSLPGRRQHRIRCNQGPPQLDILLGEDGLFDLAQNASVFIFWRAGPPRRHLGKSVCMASSAASASSMVA